MSLRISWSLAKVCEKLGAEAVEALFVYSTLAAYAGGKLIPLKEARKLFERLGCSPATARRRIAALRRPVVSQGQVVSLVIITNERRPRIQVRSAWKLEQELGLMHLEGFKVAKAALADLSSFKLALYAGVGFSRGRGADGGKTISRGSLKDLTGASRWTQRRNEAKLEIIVQPNYAQVWDSEADLRERRANGRALFERYGPRIRHFENHVFVVQISNTYYSPSAWISFLSDDPRLKGALARDVEHLIPERGGRYLRQTFPDRRPSADEIRAVHNAGGNVDIKLANLAHPTTGERVGFYARLEANSLYRYGELNSALHLMALDQVGWMRTEDRVI